MFIAPLIATVALKFGPWEYFAIGVFSMTMIISVAGEDVFKGILSAILGMALAMTGSDPIGMVNRYNFGNHALDHGVTTTVLLCGMFAIPELLKLAMNAKDSEVEVRKVEKIRGFGISVKEYLSHWKNIVLSAAIGAYVGLLPGIGGSSASLFSYMTAKKNSKHPEKFGKGSVEGLIASETANNACIGGSIIPLLSLGIPGSASAAILLSALTLHNVQCGPLAFSRHADLIYLIFAICLVANVFMVVIERGVLSGYLKLLTTPRRIVMVIVIMMCFVGAYSSSNNYTDVILFVLAGVIGFFLQKVGITVAPIILGYILSEIIEENFVRALAISRGSVTGILSRPIAIVFLVIAIGSLLNSVRKTLKASRDSKAEAA